MVITREQRQAIYRKYQRDNDGAATYRAFRSRVQGPMFGDVIMLPWLGMWLGIEADGHTHS